MELRELINQSHQLREQLKQLQAQENDLQDQLRTLETGIKAHLDESGKEYESLTEEEFQLMMADLGDPKKLSIEVVYADTEVQIIQALQLARGATIEDGIIMSGILEQCPDVELASNKVGIHGSVKPLTEVLKDGDRIEIYRPVSAAI